MQTRIRRARPEEAEALSSLAIRSKAHWPYPDEHVAVFRAELSLSPEQVGQCEAHVIEEGERVLGFYTLLGAVQGEAELEHIFVDADFLRQGFGRTLFHHACSVAIQLGARVLTIKSDPHAAAFYRSVGADFTGEIASSIPGRKIPTFGYSLVVKPDKP